jgi:hypothetical protein
MRFKLIILFVIISFSASAQFSLSHLFKKKLPPFHPRAQIKGSQLCHAGVNSQVLAMNDEVKPFVYDESQFSMHAQEKELLKQAKHNMSWRIYNVASYNFSDLALLYVKMHRFSEAKWYFLQSNNISRQENDDRHTIANLVNLAEVKENLGDLVSARADLNEARDLAQVRGMREKVDEIEKRIPLLGQNKTSFTNHYAETAAAGSKDL